MKKWLGGFALVLLSVFLVAGSSLAWQGRMAGMGDPYGLVGDESDFLIHPANIAMGEGTRFYGDYRFTYTDVTNWDTTLERFNTAGVLLDFYDFDTSGDEYNNNAMVGTGFSLGPGRMGVFFTYNDLQGDYDGKEDLLGVSNAAAYDITHNDNNLALRLLYGLPVLGMDAGVELGMTYRDEEKKWWIPDTKNDVWPSDYEQNLHYFMNPYNSRYWEIFWKAGLGKNFDDLRFDWTINGGHIIASDNEYEYQYFLAPGVDEHVVMDGDVSGYSIGTDLWFRYQLNDALTLPFVVSVSYISRQRDGDGTGIGLADFGERYSYEHEETNFEARIGGGVQKKLDTGGLISAALYYHYLQGREHQWFRNPDYPFFYDYTDYPKHKEHRLEVQLAGEWELTPSTALRMGLNPFYGWVVAHDFEQSSQLFVLTEKDDIESDGNSWGINASLGGTVKLSRVTLEPFINGGYFNLDLKGDGDHTIGPGLTIGSWGFDQQRSEWFIGGGLSILFGL
ncbi:MAG: hypothetical protein HF981_21655 [Desulfobacteraceae bacterium]|nr:hypothetical protein [Desulfobacteraceae bacterium]MBC2753016.1 hypothetical protein [Desulfobacteraceae bacterium]